MSKGIIDECVDEWDKHLHSTTWQGDLDNLKKSLNEKIKYFLTQERIDIETLRDELSKAQSHTTVNKIEDYLLGDEK